jgi:restriction system protein
MARQHPNRESALRRPRTGAIELLTVGALLTLLPTILAKSVFGLALANLRPFGWLLLVVGLGLLLVQRKFSAESTSRRRKPRAEPRVAEAAPRMNRLAVNSNDRRDSSSAGKGEPPSTPTRWSRDVFERIEWRRFEAVVEALFARAGFETPYWLPPISHRRNEHVPCKDLVPREVGAGARQRKRDLTRSFEAW